MHSPSRRAFSETSCCQTVETLVLLSLVVVVEMIFDVMLGILVEERRVLEPNRATERMLNDWDVSVSFLERDCCCCCCPCQVPSASGRTVLESQGRQQQLLLPWQAIVE